MKHKERVLSALRRNGFDRIPVKHQGTPEADAELMQYFNVTNQLDLLDAVGDDFRTIDVPWIGPPLNNYPDGSWDGWWGERYANISFGHGTYPEAVYLPFADVDNVEALSNFRMPTADDFEYTTIQDQCHQWVEFATVFGNAGFFDFINSIARCRGVEKVLYDIAEMNPVYLALMEQRFRLFYEMTERALQEADGAIDIVHVGEDFGSQRGLLISPKTFEAIFRPKYEQMFEMAHKYGAITMMHCCGSVRKLIPRLIDIGLDVLDVVQVSAAGMDISELHAEYSKDLAFAGSICVQSTLPFGSIEDVKREVALRLELFNNGGLILGPSHQIQALTPLDNILTMYESAGSIKLG